MFLLFVGCSNVDLRHEELVGLRTPVGVLREDFMFNPQGVSLRSGKSVQADCGQTSVSVSALRAVPASDPTASFTISTGRKAQEGIDKPYGGHHI